MMNTTWRYFCVATLVCLCVDGCGTPPADPPTAVIQASPESICLGDDHRTPIGLDAYQSAPRLALVPLPPEGDDPLEYAWTMTGAAFRLVEGGLSSPEIVVTCAGDRPLHVSLTVRNREGGEATSLKTINIVMPEGGVCPLDVD